MMNKDDLVNQSSVELDRNCSSDSSKNSPLLCTPPKATTVRGDVVGDLSDFYPSGDTVLDDDDDDVQVNKGLVNDEELSIRTNASNILDGFAPEDIFTQSVINNLNDKKDNNNETTKTSVHQDDQLHQRVEGNSRFASISTCGIEFDISEEYILNFSQVNNSEKNETAFDEINKNKLHGSQTGSTSSNQSLAANTNDVMTSSMHGVVNRHISWVRSLKELWHEETCRRALYSIPESLFDVHEQPSTPTRHRPLLATELEYEQRFKNLVAKGLELFECNRDNDKSNEIWGSIMTQTPRALINKAIISSQHLRKHDQENRIDFPSPMPLSLDMSPTETFSESVLRPNFVTDETILSQYTTMENDAPKVPESTLIIDCSRKQEALQNDILRLSGLLPDEEDDEYFDAASGNEVAWQTQTALSIVEEIRAVESDHNDIIKLNQDAMNAKSFENLVNDDSKDKQLPTKHSTTKSGESDKVKKKDERTKLISHKRGVIFKRNAKPPLGGRLGRLLHTQHEIPDSRMKSEANKNDYSLVDVVDRKRMIDKKSERRKRKKVGFVDESPVQAVHAKYSESMATHHFSLTPDSSSDIFNTCKSPPWTSPNFRKFDICSPTADVSGAISRLIINRRCVLKPSFATPQSLGISLGVENCLDSAAPHLHSIPFYSRAEDKHVITQKRSKRLSHNGKYGWRPQSINHVDEVPAFGCNPSQPTNNGDNIGTLESCLAVTIPPSSLGLYRAHRSSRRCLRPAFFPPSRAQVFVDCPPLESKQPQSIVSDEPNFLTPPMPSHSPAKVTKIMKVANSKDRDYKSPRKSQLATPTQTQPKQNLEMKVSHPNRNMIKKQSRNFAADSLLSPTSESVDKKLSGKPLSPKSFSKLKTFSLELFASCTGPNMPNPKLNSVHCAFYVVNEILSTSDAAEESVEYGVVCWPHEWTAMRSSSYELNCKNKSSSMSMSNRRSGVMMLIRGSSIPAETTIHLAKSEIDLFERIVEIVKDEDPDFLVGYEVQKSSWGYLLERGLHLTDHSVTPPRPNPLNMLQMLSRVPGERASARNEHDIHGQEHDSGIWIIGRTVFNLWRRMRKELKLTSYTMSSVSSHLLQKSFPEFSVQQLSSWFRKGSTMGLVVNYLYRQSQLNLTFIDKLDLIRRTAGLQNNIIMLCCKIFLMNYNFVQNLQGYMVLISTVSCREGRSIA